MRDNTQEKALVQVDKNSIFYKIKSFFRKIFHKDGTIQNLIVNKENIDDVKEKEENKNSFIQSIKIVEDEETKLLKLQRKYRSGEIKEEELTEEQVNSLCSLYDRQIANLKRSNEIRKQKLLEYKRKLQ